MKQTDEALRDAAHRVLEAAFEDGECRENLGERVGLPRLATAHGVSTPDGFNVYFENGDQYVLEIVARPVGLTARLSKTEMTDSDGAAFCRLHDRWETTALDADHTPAKMQR